MHMILWLLLLLFSTGPVEAGETFYCIVDCGKKDNPCKSVCTVDGHEMTLNTLFEGTKEYSCLALMEQAMRGVELLIYQQSNEMRQYMHKTFDYKHAFDLWDKAKLECWR